MTEKWEFKKITLDDMIEYIETNSPQDKAWFKNMALNLDGKGTGVVGRYNHLRAVRGFCKEYMPDILPQKKPKKPNKSEMLLNW